MVHLHFFNKLPKTRIFVGLSQVFNQLMKLLLITRSQRLELVLENLFLHT